MSSTDRQNELLELYKLHAELADRVSGRREAANRLYVGVLTAILVLPAVLMRFGGVPDGIYIAIGVLGMLLSVAWFIVIRSYRQLNTGKFLALNELEEQLAYPLFQKEWEFLGQGERISKYWKLTVVETFMPLVFFLFFLALPFAPVLFAGVGVGGGAGGH